MSNMEPSGNNLTYSSKSNSFSNAAGDFEKCEASCELEFPDDLNLQEQCKIECIGLEKAPSTLDKILSYAKDFTTSPEQVDESEDTNVWLWILVILVIIVFILFMVSKLRKNK